MKQSFYGLIIILSTLYFSSCEKSKQENIAPTIAQLISPKDNSKNLELKAVLTWEACSDPDGETVLYDVWFGEKDSDLIKIESNYSSLSVSIDTLKLFTTYRWYIISKDNNGGETYSGSWSFTTKETENKIGTFIDSRDNKEYKTIEIGSQIWMAENLSYLPTINSYWDYNSSTKPCYYVCEYEGNNLSEAKQNIEYKKYGALYNKVAALEACPDGWHLPTDEEWKTLETYMGISLYDLELLDSDYRAKNYGQKLKSTSGWDSDGNGTNETGFNALPGRKASNPGLHGYATFWTATHIENDNWGGRSFIRGLGIRSYIFRENYPDYYGLSVRCIKD